MSQAVKSPTTNRIQFASAGAVRRRPAPATATLVLPAGLAAALEELCMLTAYHPDGFTYTAQMESWLARTSASAPTSPPPAPPETPIASALRTSSGPHPTHVNKEVTSSCLKLCTISNSNP
jgi:hypothetical protein